MITNDSFCGLVFERDRVRTLLDGFNCWPGKTEEKGMKTNKNRRLKKPRRPCRG